MTIQYKNETYLLSTNTSTTVLTISTSAVGIVKSVQAVHKSASNADVDLLVLKNGGAARVVAHAQLNKSFVNLASNTINLEAGDTLLMESDTSNAITGVISYALIDRSQENGYTKIYSLCTKTKA